MKIFGILNITTDSFFDGNKYIDPKKAALKYKKLLKEGSYAIDIGAVSSNPSSAKIDTDIEMKRIEAVLKLLDLKNCKISIDSFNSETQKKLLTDNWPFRLDYINDINGFNEPKLYPALKQHKCKLIVMHSIQKTGIATKMKADPKKITSHALQFLEKRINQLLQAGINQDRIIIDPGMGFFVGTDPLCSLKLIQNIPKFKDYFKLPVMISLSRKSFIRKLANCSLQESLIPTVLAETIATSFGADFIRTHSVKELKNAVAFWHSTSFRIC